MTNLVIRAINEGPRGICKVSLDVNNLAAKLVPTLQLAPVFIAPTLGKHSGSKPLPNLHVVYLIQCNKWLIQYVGEMENALCVLPTDHRFNINNCCLDRPVARHFNLVDHSLNDLSIMVIEKICKEDTTFGK